MEIRDRLFIGGELVDPAGTNTIEVVNPATEEVMGRAPDATDADVDRAVAAARRAFDEGPWPTMTVDERADVLAKAADNLRNRQEEISTLITSEMGSPISFSIMAQAFAPVMLLDYYIGLARGLVVEEVRAGLLGTTLVRREPVGVVGAIVPWNVPQIVLKPAPETPLDAYILAEAFADAGLPKGVLNIVPAGREVGEHLVKHPDVDKISFTGSTAAGKRIMSLCGEQLKRVSLELGGKSAAVILDDADLDTTIPGLLPNSMMNNGEACVAQTRILAPRDRYQDVVDRLVDAVRAMPVGDPMDPSTQIGPLVASRQRDRVEGYIAVGQEEGAKVAIGGGRPAGIDKGWYVEPTVFVDVDNKMRIAQEEIFGPVVAVIPYDSDAEAVRIANDSSYGLSGSVWTADPARGVDVARKVRTGTYTVNGFTLDFATPFGGFKQSGIGRELGPEGVEEYLEYKSVNLPSGYTPGS